MQNCRVMLNFSDLMSITCQYMFRVRIVSRVGIYYKYIYVIRKTGLLPTSLQPYTTHTPIKLPDLCG